MTQQVLAGGEVAAAEHTPAEGGAGHPCGNGARGGQIPAATCRVRVCIGSSN
jgi:hypothetical protein